MTGVGTRSNERSYRKNVGSKYDHVFIYMYQCADFLQGRCHAQTQRANHITSIACPWIEDSTCMTKNLQGDQVNIYYVSCMGALFY